MFKASADPDAESVSSDFARDGLSAAEDAAPSNFSGAEAPPRAMESTFGRVVALNIRKFRGVRSPVKDPMVVRGAAPRISAITGKRDVGSAARSAIGGGIRRWRLCRSPSRGAGGRRGAVRASSIDPRITAAGALALRAVPRHDAGMFGRGYLDMRAAKPASPEVAIAWSGSLDSPPARTRPAEMSWLPRPFRSARGAFARMSASMRHAAASANARRVEKADRSPTWSRPWAPFGEKGGISRDV